MNTGLLWFDDSKTPIEQKLERAAKHYENKFGQKPTRCLVHPSVCNRIAGDSKMIGDIKIVASWQVLPDHFWLMVAGGSQS